MEEYCDTVTTGQHRTFSFAAELGDADQFAQSLAEYDSMSRLDPWKTKLLLVAKQKIVDGGEDEDDLT